MKPTAAHSGCKLPALRAFRALPASRRSWSTARPVRCNVQPGVDRDANLRRNLPAAPPTFVPPPPPPPPPPTPTSSGINLSRRGLFGIIVGGTALWYAALNASVPLVGVDKPTNTAFVRTKGGNVVAAKLDPAGRLFLFDKAGNIYYDTEDPNLGVYIVDRSGTMYNKFLDKDGKAQLVTVGNIAELQTIEVGEIGGVNLKDLQESFRQARSGKITGFFKPVDPETAQWTDLMPPNALIPTPDGKGVAAPIFIDDLELDLQKKMFSGAPKEQSMGEFLNSFKQEGS